MGVLKERGNKQAVLVCLVSWKVLNCSNAAGATDEHTALGKQSCLSEALSFCEYKAHIL